MYTNFMLSSVSAFRDWLKNADIDWGRVNDKSTIEFVADEDESDGRKVTATVCYEDGKEENCHELTQTPPSCVSGDFGASDIPLQKMASIVKNSVTKMLMFKKPADGECVLYEYTPAARHGL